MNLFFDAIQLDVGTGCWNWMLGKNGKGYGVMWPKGKGKIYAHRIFAHMFLGFALDSKLNACHRCDNPSCCNPKHLFIGMQSENMRDMVAKRRNFRADVKECPHGHEYSAENSGIDSNGRRYCKICHSNRMAEYRAARR